MLFMTAAESPRSSLGAGERLQESQQESRTQGGVLLLLLLPTTSSAAHIRIVSSLSVSGQRGHGSAVWNRTCGLCAYTRLYNNCIIVVVVCIVCLFFENYCNVYCQITQLALKKSLLPIIDLIVNQPVIVLFFSTLNCAGE